MSINNELTALLKQEGCKLVGFADLTVLSDEMREHIGKNLTVGIIMATAYAPETVWDKLDDAEKEKIRQDWAIGDPLKRYEKTAKAFLKEKKYRRSTAYQSMVLTYKMLSTMAGIGWVGKNALLVTKEYGPAVRFTAVLTNAPFECGEPILKSQCPADCTHCADVCPAKAIKGGLWERGIHRDEFFDAKACGSARSGCGGACIGVCPLT